MPNILINPNSGIIEFTTGTAGVSTFDANIISGNRAARLSYDNFGSLNLTSYVSNVTGLDRFTVDGANGRLFSVTDNLSGSLFSVNDIAGLPIIEAFDDNTVIMGAFNRNDFVLTGNSLGLGGLPNTGTTKLYVSGNVQISGGLFVSGNPVLTGSSTLYATSVNLASTGSTLNSKIDNLSGVSVLTFGNQNISGNKTFVSYTGTTGYNSITFLNLSGVNLNIDYTLTTGTTVTFTQNSYDTQVVDTIDNGVKITRSQFAPWFYNPDNQNGYYDTPTNTLWNIDGWSDFSNLTTRNYASFTSFDVYYYYPNSITSKQWVMKDTLNNAYYKFEFTSFDYWDDYYGYGGAGFSYKRTRLFPVYNYITGKLNLQLGNNKLKGSINLETRPTVNSTPILLSGEALSTNLINRIVYNTGNQTISGVKQFESDAIFNKNLTVNQTGTFYDTSIFVDEMTVSGMNLTLTNGTGIFSFLNISGNYDIYSQIENSKKLAIAYAIAL
jgi:hypothetical protein